MTDKFTGLTLLILGDNAGSLEAIRYAKSHGARVILTDSVDNNETPAKKIANEVWKISTADIQGLVRRVKSHSIDGVFAGISEFNLLAAIRVSEQSGLRFFCSEDQWEKIADKSQFRRLCDRFNVPAPATYYVGKNISNSAIEGIVYPVIVKPVDGSASTGITICLDDSNIETAFSDAISSSKSGVAIVEKFVSGVEFTAHYTIVNGSIVLSCIDDRYSTNIGLGDSASLPGARVYPSLMVSEYLEHVNENVLRMIESLNLRNAVLFVQGLFDDASNSFSIFEAGLRSAAELPSRFLSKSIGLNHLELLVDHVLVGKPTNYDQTKEDPLGSNSCSAIYSFTSLGGEVGTIEGLAQVLDEVPEIVANEVRYEPGQVVPNGTTLRQILLRFVILGDSRERLVEVMTRINQLVDVYSTNGESMVIKMRPERILTLDQ